MNSITLKIKFGLNKHFHSSNGYIRIIIKVTIRINITNSLFIYLLTKQFNSELQSQRKYKQAKAKTKITGSKSQ